MFFICEISVYHTGRGNTTEKKCIFLFPNKFVSNFLSPGALRSGPMLPNTQAAGDPAEGACGATAERQALILF